MRKQIGWDIGGAHLKAVLLNDVGQVESVTQVPCALWLGLDRLKSAMVKLLQDFRIKPTECGHAVTMTGELVDLFANRHEGVVKIAQLVTKVLGDKVQFYCMDETIAGSVFLTLPEVLKHTGLVASANWHASASLVARYMPDALLIDIGSTTTDIIAIENGRVVNRGLTDAERMQQDALVYTGVVRTPVMAVSQKLMLDGKETNVAAEYFATMADVYRLTAELSPAADMAETADGKDKTPQASAKRLARMVGYDVEDKTMGSWLQLAAACREKQISQIQLAAIKHMKDGMKIVGAGAGVFLVKAVAQALGHSTVMLTELLNSEVEDGLAVCLPAYAVAVLGSNKGAV